ncbi:MAG: HD domain-containing protein [Phycisphaerales bacterium]|nr:HD domain-containing protein [Phycisphaerales bacterium]MCI0630723.1 HD domain-containing protein [Phycisphaerales bacterium]MCI0676553.1 HD domain-containing protein [Phycisphaerales bacterium]
MNTGDTQRELIQSAISGHSALRPALRQVGIVLIACAESGELLAKAPQGEDWLADLLCASNIFRSLLQSLAPGWSGESEPREVEPIPGLWLVPMPLLHRRRRAGYAIALIPTKEFLHAEQLAAMCQASQADLELSRLTLMKLSLPGPSDVPRLATLVRMAHEDRMMLASNEQAIESVGKQLAESYEEMNLLYTIIQSMTVQERPERFVALACKELLATLPYAWIGIQLLDDRQRLKALSGRLIIAGDPGHSPAVLRNATRNLGAHIQHDKTTVLEPGSNPDHLRFAVLGKTVLVQPVSSDTNVIGLLIAGDKRGPDTAASSVDMKLLAATATHMAIFLENAALYEDLNAMFLGTLEALTASIDAKDRYTCGHSRRVALLTAQLGQAIGLDEHTVGRVHIAGLVHDVGKIGVPEAVLLKPGKLSPKEFAWIRKHPEIGYRILKDIPQLTDILPGVLHHHERWDGGGYPQGLAGEGIPLVARLIALADSFDAMSSTRTYRSALSRSQVLDEIDRCVGTQFDPVLAKAFVELDFSQFDQLVRQHRETERALPGARGEAA